MLSILVCSVSPLLLSQLKQNIEETIGITYELLAFDNRIEKKGICEVYNLLAVQSQFPYLCFLHEDVLFKTNNWGRLLLATFEHQPEAGVIGIAGSKYKSKTFSGWYTGVKEFDCANVKHRNANHEEEIQLKPNATSHSEEVVCVDGVLICCKKEIWSKIKFDEKNITGFHLYDLDFSLRAAQICTILVVYFIELIHLTEGGSFTDNWVEATISYHLQHQKSLPITKNSKADAKTEVAIAKTTLDALKNYDISWKNKKQWIHHQKLYKYPDLFYSILKFLLYKPLRLKYLHSLVKDK